MLLTAISPEEHCRLTASNEDEAGIPAASTAARCSLTPAPGFSTLPTTTSSTRLASNLSFWIILATSFISSSSELTSLNFPLPAFVSAVLYALTITTSSGLFVLTPCLANMWFPICLHLENNQLDAVDLLPSNEGRQSIVQQLMGGYGLLDDAQTRLLTPANASVDDLAKFHDREYAAHLLRKRDWSLHVNPLSPTQRRVVQDNHNNNNNGGTRPDASTDADDTRFGLVFDCPVFPFLDEYCSVTAGASLTAAEFLIETHSTVINWSGGRHHAHKSEASGFCYVNDVVLAILRLRQKYKRVAYIDLDLHHGDGVSEAFKFSRNVLTISVHRTDMHFFPGSGKQPVDGFGRGVGYDVNIPTKKGLSDRSFTWIVDNIVLPKLVNFSPECMVIQCGGDGLCTDLNFREWNLTLRNYGRTVNKIVNTARIPTMLLGGGGYNALETCKLWCYITGLVLGKDADRWDALPDMSGDLLDFREMEFWQNDNPRNMLDTNSDEYLMRLQRAILHLGKKNFTI
ncbi:hypothetical protein OGAPHI_006807 [Ogataea philodendri]|uniref:histone deacetylase n=1 Tax=Ogataea philodendri TaxID=1378263 RepID=A0A9P8T101_9ASCO|nr:uncharacterized protein OGAPHI_006807 [Ogataea philodendri]KAH3661400.1 hypothetical protein OGAPHI_006807 [Ogataea philodendri]